jgi:hypothetical protein
MSEIMSSQHYSLRQVKLSDPVFHRVFKARCHVMETAQKVGMPNGPLHYDCTYLAFFNNTQQQRQ